MGGEIIGEIEFLEWWGKGSPQLTDVDGEGTTLAKALGALQNRSVRVASFPLTGGAIDAIVGYWQNPLPVRIIVEKFIIDIKTAGGTATAVLNGGTSSSGTVGSDNLIDGADANAGVVYDNITNKGSNGKTIQRLDAKGGTTDFITVQGKVEATTNLVGIAYVFYVPEV